MTGFVWRDLGRIEYSAALELQRGIAKSKKEGIMDDDLLLLMEHPPVITFGRAKSPVHVTGDADELERRGISTVEIERGGDVTYHGPGQLVGYPILDLSRFRQDLHWYLRSLEEVLIRTLASFDLEAGRAEGLTGVWVGGGGAIAAAPALEMMRAGTIRKVASIGIHASRWITTHGFALNHTDDALEGFRWIVPCGLAGVTVTSLESEGIAVSGDELKRRIVSSFEAVFDVTIRPTTSV
jgi:lipoyl(octanoyl) transferase